MRGYEIRLLRMAKQIEYFHKVRAEQVYILLTYISKQEGYIELMSLSNIWDTMARLNSKYLVTKDRLKLRELGYLFPTALCYYTHPKGV